MMNDSPGALDGGFWLVRGALWQNGNRSSDGVQVLRHSKNAQLSGCLRKHSTLLLQKPNTGKRVKAQEVFSREHFLWKSCDLSLPLVGNQWSSLETSLKCLFKCCSVSSVLERARDVPEAWPWSLSSNGRRGRGIFTQSLIREQGNIDLGLEAELSSEARVSSKELGVVLNCKCPRGFLNDSGWVRRTTDG